MTILFSAVGMMKVLFSYDSLHELSVEYWWILRAGAYLCFVCVFGLKFRGNIFLRRLGFPVPAPCQLNDGTGRGWHVRCEDSRGSDRP